MDAVSWYVLSSSWVFLVGWVVMLLVAGAAGIDNASITQGRLPYPFVASRRSGGVVTRCAA